MVFCPCEKEEIYFDKKKLFAGILCKYYEAICYRIYEYCDRKDSLHNMQIYEDKIAKQIIQAYRREQLIFKSISVAAAA